MLCVLLRRKALGHGNNVTRHGLYKSWAVGRGGGDRGDNFLEAIKNLRKDNPQSGRCANIMSDENKTLTASGAFNQIFLDRQMSLADIEDIVLHVSRRKH